MSLLIFSLVVFLTCFSSRVFLIILLNLLIFALATLQIYDSCESNVELGSVVNAESLTDLDDSSLNPSIFIFKDLCLPSNLK